MSADKHRAKARRMELLRLLFPTAKPPFFPVDRVADVKSLARLARDGFVKIFRGDRITGGRHGFGKLSTNKRTWIQRVGSSED